MKPYYARSPEKPSEGSRSADSAPVTILTDSGEAYRINAAVREALTRLAHYLYVNNLEYCEGDVEAYRDRGYPALSASLAQPTPDFAIDTRGSTAFGGTSTTPHLIAIHQAIRAIEGLAPVRNDAALPHEFSAATKAVVLRCLLDAQRGSPAPLAQPTPSATEEET